MRKFGGGKMNDKGRGTGTQTPPRLGNKLVRADDRRRTGTDYTRSTGRNRGRG